MAGGLGKRLHSEVPNLQKVVAPVEGKPFLEYVLKNLYANKVRDVILAVGYRNRDILNMIDDIKPVNMDIHISMENSPLGTGGAVRNSMDLIKNEDVLICNGDSLSIFPFQKLYQFHKDKSAQISILIATVENISRYGSVKVNNKGQIVKFEEKKSSDNQGFINSGIYILKKQIISELPLHNFSLEKDFFPGKCNKGMYGLIDNFPFIDIGVPDDYFKAKEFINSSM